MDDDIQRVSDLDSNSCWQTESKNSLPFKYNNFNTNKHDQNNQKENNMLFKYIYLDVPWSLNYVVYRSFSDLKKYNEKDMVKFHRVCTFVTEYEARDYCDYRNEMVKKYESDDVNLIVRTNI